MNELERSLAFKPHEELIRQVRELSVHELPEFSVVIPTLNQAAFIPQALESVLAQEYPESRLDILVVDGGSTDGTLDILTDYETKTEGLVKFISECDEGQFHAVNKGIRATKGEIIAWLNSDDIYLEDTFWRVVTFFHFNQSAFVVYGKNIYTNENLDPVFDYPVDWSPLLTEQRRKMMHFCLPPQPSLFFKREAVVLAGALQSSILDYELWLRWQKYFQFHFIDEYLSLSRLHSEAKTIRERRELILGIMKTVHSYYSLVSTNWTLSLAHYEEYGDKWLSGEHLSVTKYIRFKAYYYWLIYNLIWLPKAFIRALKSASKLISESFRGRI